MVEAWKIDTFIASPTNPIAAFENWLGVVSLGFTFATDVLSGNTSIQGGYVGKDTIVSGRNFLLGNTPESNVDLAVNLSQLKYDLDRFNEIKPGGSIYFTDVDNLVGQIYWYDSPFQDFANILFEWKKSMANPIQ